MQKYGDLTKTLRLDFIDQIIFNIEKTREEDKIEKQRKNYLKISFLTARHEFSMLPVEFIPGH